MDMVWYPDMMSNAASFPSDARWGTAPALRFHQGIEGYRPTALTALPGLAKKLGLSQIWVKDESSRFGLNAFKGLGCSYAMANYLCGKANIPVDRNAFSRLRSPEIQSALGKLTFITATDGNHGRGVAWAAGLFGHRAVVYMPKGTVKERFENIRALGAEVQILPLSYDDAVRAAADTAQKNGWVLVQDTAWTGYETIPTQIMEGYTTLAHEIEEQLGEYGDQRPTHLFLQAGVGSMAGAVSAYFVQRWKNTCPKIIIVEPDRADCHYRTVKANDGKLHKVTEEMDSIMAGLCCGEPNSVSWEILRRCASAFISCEDACTENGMRLLGHPQPGDKAVVSGESGAVTTGVLAELLTDPRYVSYREKLGLDQNSRVLLISTEGDTDQENYKRILER